MSRRAETIQRLVAAAAPQGPVLPAFLDRLGAYGVRTSDPELAQRQRFTTFCCYACAGNAISHLVINLGHALWPLWLIHLYNIVIAIAVLLVPLLHRLGPNVAAHALAALVFVGNLFVVFALGSSSDLHIYFTCAGALVFVFGVENWRAYGSWFLVAVGAILVSVHLAPPAGFILPEDVELRRMLSGHAYLNAIAINCLLLFIALLQLRQARLELAEAHRRSEALLGAMLPSPIAERLKAAPDQRIADRADGLSVLFADLVGFTEAAHAATPEEVVTYLDDLYRRFDELTALYGAEKIKTIGDCYLAVAGSKSGDAYAGAVAIGRLGLALRDAVGTAPRLAGVELALRVGIHIGSATAGVIGTTRFTYDVWGDAVNTASRMETNGLPGEVQASLEFARLTGDVFEFEPRGPLEVKGLGRIETRLIRAVRAKSALNVVQPPSMRGNEAGDVSEPPRLV